MVTITKQMREQIQVMINAEKMWQGEYNEVTDIKLRKNCSDEQAFNAAYVRWNTRIS